VGVQSRFQGKGPGVGNDLPAGDGMTYTTVSAAWVQGTIDWLRRRDLWRANEPSPISSQVRVVGVANNRGFEATFDPATGASAFWAEIPGGGIFTSGLSASFRTDFEFTHVVEYAGLGRDVAPWAGSFSLADGFRTGWTRLPPLEGSLPATAGPDCSPMVGSDYDFTIGHRPFVLMRSVQGVLTEWWWRLLTDPSTVGWRKMLR